MRPEFNTIKALIITQYYFGELIWGFVIIFIVYYTPKPYSNYQGHYITQEPQTRIAEPPRKPQTANSGVYIPYA